MHCCFVIPGLLQEFGKLGVVFVLNRNILCESKIYIKSVTIISGLFFAIVVEDYLHNIWEKSRIRETLTLSTDADHRTDNFFWGGW